MGSRGFTKYIQIFKGGGRGRGGARQNCTHFPFTIDGKYDLKVCLILLKGFGLAFGLRVMNLVKC